MKKCAFCAESIHDLARKCPHCLEYQDVRDVPRKSMEPANLVISLIGILAVIFGVFGGLFGYFGFTSIADLQKAVTAFKEKSDKLSLEFGITKKSLDNLYVRQILFRADILLDGLVLGALNRNPDLLQELEKIQIDLERIELVAGDTKRKKDNLLAILSAIKLLKLKDENFAEVIKLLIIVSDDDPQKHRILGLTYYKLYLKTQEKKYLNRNLFHTERYNTIAQQFNKKTFISRNNLAGSLILRGSPEDYKKAREILMSLIKEKPLDADLYYNLATLDVKEGRLYPALSRLEKAKRLGFFELRTNRDIFDEDEDFDALRTNEDPKIQERLKALTR